MAAILNLAILDSGILVYPLKLTHTCQDWVPPFAQKKLHSHYHPSFTIWLKLIQSDSNSFILTQLDDGSHLEFCHLEFGHPGFRNLSLSSQTHSYLPRLVPTICTKKKLLHTSLPTICTKKLPSFIQTQLIDGGHLDFCHIEFCHLGFSFYIVEFRHLVFFSQIDSKTLSLHSDSDSN